MLTLPEPYSTLLSHFRSHFSNRIWKLALVLLGGAILAPNKRTVTACLRIVGLHHEKCFLKYHRVLSRAVWSSLARSRTWLLLLVGTFAATGTLIIGLDDTLERRWGLKIRARGIYRDPVRSSHSHFVKASGLRWLCTMLLVPMPWAQRVWALPFLTVLAPSERYYANRVRAAKTLTAWVWQVLLQVRRWLPERRIVVVADSSFAVISLLARIQRLTDPLIMVVRFRLDAALYEQAPPRQPKQKGRARKKGKRLPTLEQRLHDTKTQWHRVLIPNWYGEGQRLVEICSDLAVWYHSGQPTVLLRWVLIRDPQGKFKSQALLCTDPHVSPEQIVQWFILRWQLEVTLEEVRAHLGVETQRQWSDKAIVRTTPALLGLFSLVTLLAHHSMRRGKFPVRQAAWYTKSVPTFSDALALVRQTLWQHMLFSMCKHTRDAQKISERQIQRLTSALIRMADPEWIKSSQVFMQIQKYESPAHAVQHVHLVMLVGAITALAVACLSVWLLDTTPAIDWDEGWTATIAENWVERGFYGRLSNNELAPPGLSASFPVVGTVALAMRVFGVGIWQGRLAAVITMTAALALYFLLLRSWFDWRVALTTMCILVLLAPHPRANVFWMARQMFAEPLQFLTLLGGFAALLLTRTKSRLWLVAVILFWATALASKAQVLPFFAVMGAALVGLNVLNRRYRDARFALIAVVGALVGWQLELRTFDWILSGHSMPAEPLPDISLVLGFVPSPSIRITAFVVAWLVGTPVILGLAYFLFQRIRHNHWLRLLDRDEDLRISLWVLATTWFLWYVFMSHAGITRYIFSPIFFGAPFAAVMFRDFTDNFNVRSTMWRLVAPLRTKRLSRKNVGAWIVFSLILFYLPLTLFISYQTATATEGRDLIMTTDYLNQNTLTDARIETYESPLFIYLHRSYHYPPDALHLELNKRAAHLPAVVNYDALQSDPDYLVVGPTARTWQLYDPVIAAGVFRLIQSFGQYTIYQRVRP